MRVSIVDKLSEITEAIKYAKQYECKCRKPGCRIIIEPIIRVEHVK